MAGIILMITGVLIFVVGLVFYSTSRKPVEQVNSNHELDKIVEMAIADGVLTNNEKNLIKHMTEEKNVDYDSIIKVAEQQISEFKTDTAETEMIDFNKKNGTDFEKYIVQKFDKKYFQIKEWAGDKFVDGIYAKTTTQPDFLVEFKLKNQTLEFSVECKWRKNYYQGGIEFASSDQFQRYQDFERSRNIPVFVAIGVGGKGINPEHLYIVPLKSIESNFIPTKLLKNFEKNSESDFFFNPKTKELK